ncbi:MAG: type II toxin-antitoxin system HicA family toxin [Lutibacter sp.]|jgi:hypothetical protein
MSTKHLRNIPLKLYREFLTEQGCICNRTNGGHEHWSRKDLLRPITVQTHVDPVPEFIIINALRQLGVTKKFFLDWI